jgi:transcriptional regulatory protein LevR
LYFGKEASETLEDIMPEFERIMFRDSYDLIWKSLTEGEKELVRCIYRTGDGKAESIKKLMNNASNYSVYRSRLINKHLVDSEKRGYLRIGLPRFDKFIELWGDE